jgi:light-regulated signal transduction histidine kinase (bacteriophytochrome)
MVGFKQEFSEKIFLLFKRLETNPKYSGTGLGLAICSRIVENHKGF